MLEVVFDPGTKGSLKHAKNYDPNSWKKGALAFVGKKFTDEELEKRFAGQPIGGSSKDVVQLGFFLDMGNISDAIDGPDRKDLYDRLFNIMPGQPSDSEHVFEELRQDYEHIRESDCRLSKVVMPEYWQEEENTLIEGGWNSVDAGKFYRFLEFEKRVPGIEKRINANRWKEMVKENAPLRALVNGSLMSVPIDFYDHIIRKCLPDGPVVMGKLLNSIMRYPLGVSDTWYRFRIEKMIKDGEIDIVGVKDEDHPYGAILRKRDRR